MVLRDGQKQHHRHDDYLTAFQILPAAFISSNRLLDDIELKLRAPEGPDIEKTDRTPQGPISGHFHIGHDNITVPSVRNTSEHNLL
jgi:hypothetical protein